MLIVFLKILHRISTVTGKIYLLYARNEFENIQILSFVEILSVQQTLATNTSFSMFNFNVLFFEPCDIENNKFIVSWCCRDKHN
jgi:hypothetical protein